MLVFTLALTLAIAPASAIHGCSKPDCADSDGDRYGSHCASGRDCDDTNPARNIDCDSVPPPDCDAIPEAPGCPCFAGTVVPCFLADDALEGIGQCRRGSSICRNGFYGLCTGFVGPSDELCNGRDDDCDGTTDELVLSPCGGCDASCSGSVWGPGGTPFATNANLANTPAGALELARTVTPRDAIFFANTGEDTVSHISATAIAETSRHASGGDSPTRVAVDYFGDAFVTNEALAGQGTLTKLGGTLAGCVDRDFSGTIETSTGPTDVPLAADDECIVFSVPVGSVDEVPRAIAVDGSSPGGGDPWIGLWAGEAVIHVDGSTGATIERVAIPGFRPFSAAFDGRGYLWLASETGELVRIDRRSSPPSVERTLINLACYVTHAIAVDVDGAIVATGQNCDDVYRFDPATKHLSSIATLPSPRGIAIASGAAYVAHTDARVTELSTNPLVERAQMDAWALSSSPLESIAIAVDSSDFVWMASARGGPNGVGLATRFDPVSLAVTHHVPLGAGPRGFGDGTGRALRGAFVQTGETSAVFHGCENGAKTAWLRLHLDIDPGASSSATIEGRWAPSDAELGTAAFGTLATIPGDVSPVTLALPENGVLELRVRLDSTARDSSPLVRRIGLETRCFVILE